MAWCIDGGGGGGVTYPHLRELGLVGVERDDHLVRDLVCQVSPQHLVILSLQNNN
jgi:hypothetical protein